MVRADVALVQVLHDLLFLVGGLSLQVVLVVLLVGLLVVVSRIVLDSIVAWVSVMHHLRRVVPFIVQFRATRLPAVRLLLWLARLLDLVLSLLQIRADQIVTVLVLRLVML